MALVTSRVSDLSGSAAPESDFVTIVVREHPLIDKPVKLDALRAEVADLRTAENLVVLEIQNGGEDQRVVVSRDQFDKLTKDMAAVLATARGVRGREPLKRA